MSKHALLAALYALVDDMTVANGYSGEWEAVRSWDNGAFIAEDAPKLSIRLGADTNDDATNGLGNNFQQLEIPVEIRYGQTLVAPDDALEVTEYQLQELESALSDDIFKMYGSPYKIDRADVPEYCGTEYTGEGDLTPEEENDLGAYTVVGVLNFSITYKRDRGLA